MSECPILQAEGLACLDWIPQMELEGWNAPPESQEIEQSGKVGVWTEIEQPPGAYEGEHKTDGLDGTEGG